MSKRKKKTDDSTDVRAVSSTPDQAMTMAEYYAFVEKRGRTPGDSMTADSDALIRVGTGRRNI